MTYFLKRSFFLLLSLPFLAACNLPSNGTNDKTDNTNPPPARETLSKIQFECGETVFENQMPVTPLYARFDDDKVKINSVDNCNALDPSNYSTYNVPASAEDAIFSFYAGYGMYFYAEIQNNTGYIYKAELDEMSMESFNYQRIGEYEGGEYRALK